MPERARRFSGQPSGRCREIRSIVPDAKIGAIRPAACREFIFARDVFKKAGKEFNVFPLDPYPFNLDGDSVDFGLEDVFKKAIQITKDYGINQPVYISEVSWPLDISVAPDSKEAKHQANQLTKTYLLSRMTKGYDIMCMWFIMSRGHRYASLWQFSGPMPAVPAYSAVARIVENTLESKQIDLGATIKAAVFRKSNHADATIWSKDADNKIKFSISTDPDHISITDMMGNPFSTEVKGSRITIELGNSPIYLSKKGKGAFRELCQIFSQSEFNVDTPVKMTSFSLRKEKGTLCLINQTNQDLAANISLYLPETKSLYKKIKIAKGKTVSVKFDLPGQLKQGEAKIEVMCKGFDEKVTASFPLELGETRRIAFPVKIDGNLMEWKGVKPIQLNSAKNLFAPELGCHMWKGPEDLSALVYTGWDKDNFYFAAEVTDDEQFNNKTGRDIWNGDSLQFAFNPISYFHLDKQVKSPGFSDNDFDLAIALTKKGNSCFQYCGNKLWEESEFVVKRDEAKKKTFYEVRIPLKSLHILPEVGTVFGFNFVIFDDDNGNGYRYWMELTKGIAGGKNPSLFKKFILAE